MRKTLTYDDVNIVPKYSELESRENVKLNTRFTRNTDKAETKIGRNHLVTIKKGDAVKVLKYKKAQKFLNQEWIIQ